VTDDQALAQDDKARAKADRKAAKKAAAVEKAAERQKLAQEKAMVKAAEKARAAQEKAAEKEKVVMEKAQQEQAMKERLEKEKAVKDRALQMERDKAAKLEKENAKSEKGRVVQAEKLRADQTERDTNAQAKKGKPADVHKLSKRPELERAATSSSTRFAKQPLIKQPSTPIAAEPVVSQVPLLSKRPKKNKPSTKPIRVPKDEETLPEDTSTIPSAGTSEAPQLPSVKPVGTTESSSNNSRAQSVDRSVTEPTSVEELLDEIDIKHPTMDLPNHPFFDVYKINPAAKMPLEYGPLVHALSALSVGGGSFANNMPSGSIDNAVSSFQQLLETLTQTISDLLRLLPRTTWDDSSSFDGVLRDMLKGDDFLDDGGEDGGKEDEVAALTLALERRARWMEVQLSKLEELHRDINTAAVRAVLSFNDNGWDRNCFMPRVGNTLRRFDKIGIIDDGGVVRPMDADELEKKLAVAKEAAVFAETEVREVMERMQAIKPVEVAM
jgi:CCR4-NOT transcription complex subunit 4